MKIFNRSNIFNIILLSCGGLVSQAVYAALNANSSWSDRLNPQNSIIVLQAGGFNTTQGKEQNIAIGTPEGDRFTVTDSHASNMLIGLGYYIDGFDSKRLSLLYGLNGYYFGHTTVQGTILQEQQYPNLSYHYSLTNYPLYADVKMLLKNSNGNYDVTFDLGMGPNFISSTYYTEATLDGITTSDDLYVGQTSIAYSATTGVGIKFNHLIGNLPAELSYRFFYLNEGKLSINNAAVQNSLKTGNNYANALMISVYF